eukprot:scaffold43009_cov77-Phaeocystis_antarctica.AAC.2
MSSWYREITLAPLAGARAARPRAGPWRRRAPRCPVAVRGAGSGALATPMWLDSRCVTSRAIPIGNSSS